MASSELPPVTGAAQLARVQTLLAKLRPQGAERDKAGNRRYFYDQHIGLLLLSFFNPALTSLQALERASDLATVQRWLGLKGRVTPTTFSEAGGVFDPALLQEVLATVVRRVAPTVPPTASPDDHAVLNHLTAVDGSVRPVLPRFAHFLWGDAGKLSAKLHLQFEVGRGVPVAAHVTPAASSEIAAFQAALQPGRLYVTDRGYASYKLLAAIRAAGSSFVARLSNDARFDGEDQPVSAAARAAGVVRDVVIHRLGASDTASRTTPLRIVVVQPADADRTPLLLGTDRLDLAAELVGDAYRQRWQIELFFRWLKCILGCRHLLSHSLGGISLQMYAALIACVLITGISGRRPTKRIFEMFCHYFTGWATAEELETYLQSQLPDST